MSIKTFGVLVKLEFFVGQQKKNTEPLVSETKVGSGQRKKVASGQQKKWEVVSEPKCGVPTFV